MLERSRARPGLGAGTGIREHEMQQVKLFKSTERDLTSLERSINEWLVESNAKVVQMFGNIAPQSLGEEVDVRKGTFAPSDLFIAILYEKR